MALLAPKNTVQKTVETALTILVQQPDLSGSMLNALTPHILKACLDDKVLSDISKQHDLETILQRDLPELVQVYSDMPLTYRNENILPNGQTHRELLLDNLQILVGRINELENSAYEDSDQAMLVKNRFLNDKYEKNDKASNLKKIDNFSWSALKSQLQKTETFNVDDFMKKDDTHQVVLSESTIDYKVQKKFKHFMNGTYNAFLSATNSVKDKVKEDVTDYIDNWKSYPVDMMVNTVVTGLKGAGILAVGTLFYVIIQLEIKSGPAYDLAQASKMVNVDSAQMRELSIKSLQAFAAENAITINQTPENITLSNIQDGKTCYAGVSKLQEKEYIDTYELNGIKINTASSVSSAMMKEMCKKEGNIMKVSKSLKLK